MHSRVRFPARDMAAYIGQINITRVSCSHMWRFFVCWYCCCCRRAPASRPHSRWSRRIGIINRARINSRDLCVRFLDARPASPSINLFVPVTFGLRHRWCVACVRQPGATRVLQKFGRCRDLISGGDSCESHVRPHM